jgi:hypothetical protein
MDRQELQARPGARIKEAHSSMYDAIFVGEEKTRAETCSALDDD